MAIYSRMTNTKLNILKSYGMVDVPWKPNSQAHLVLARFNYNDGGEPEERYIFLHNITADFGWDEITKAVDFAEKAHFYSDEELKKALHQAQ